MARETFIVCDGCGDREPVAIPEGKPPPSFTHLKATVGTWGEEFDLCSDCYGRLLESANPRKWPRTAQAPRAA